MTIRNTAGAFLVIVFSVCTFKCSAQTLTADTSLANQYFLSGQEFMNNQKYESAIFFFEKAENLYVNNFGENSWQTANVMGSKGYVLMKTNQNDKALDCYFRIMRIASEIGYGTSLNMAATLENIGTLYDRKVELDKTLEYYGKALVLRKNILGETDTVVARTYYNIGRVYFERADYDNALDNYLKSLEVRKKILGDLHTDVAEIYNRIGFIYYVKGEYDEALKSYFLALEIQKTQIDKKNQDLAGPYSYIGLSYNSKGEYEKALEYHYLSLALREGNSQGKKTDVAESYHNIGRTYYDKGEYDKALDNYSKGLEIYIESGGEKNAAVAACYNGIGEVYEKRGEFDKALDYYLKTLEINKAILVENHPDFAASYNAIGNIYSEKGEFDKALKYHFQAIQLTARTFGENHPNLASSYCNIGSIYQSKGEYEKALDFHFKALEIRKKVLPENHPDIAASYNNLGNVYSDMIDFRKATDYLFSSLEMKRKIYGEKHPYMAVAYFNLGVFFNKINSYDHAIFFYQKGLVSSIRSFGDSLNVYSVPNIEDILNWEIVLSGLLTKARSIANGKNNRSEMKEIALQHYLACDTLIDITRKKMNTQTDKLKLGETASLVYKEAIALLTSDRLVGNLGGEEKISAKDAEMAFYFSEKNKSSVLLEALAGQEAIRFAGIPDSLIQKEKSLNKEISQYNKELAEPEKLTVPAATLYQNLLFRSNRTYDSLIVVFEKRFPEYFNLKYNNKPATVKEIQKLLDKKSAMISYIAGDSSVFIFTLTKSNLDVKKVPKIINLNDSITWFRYGLTLTSPRMKECYRRIGFLLYRQLFPDIAELDEKIENLIIIPDGPLATIPFESLLTTDYTGNIDDYAGYPFLIKKYNISYSYSANLFKKTFSKDVSTTIETTKLNDWLAFAPVFDNDAGKGMALTTRELENKLSGLKTDSLMINRSMFDRSYIAPLPATETETESILKLFDDKNLKASVLLHERANEQFIKSGGLTDYRMLHFATHGFVNSERPELSGLLLAPDTTDKEDGILYSGELFNLKLKADLVVLSAGETGLGKIQKGEGIVGLTRALLYAGAKNIIVSLWQVADASTSALMVDFYKNTLTGKGPVSYSEALRNAKLIMINQGKYSHPLFWSPFILIGK